MSVEDSAAAIVVDDLSVAYGRKQVVRRLSLQVERGQVYALLGRNGAGKSSVVRCLLGQQRASGGRLQLLGLDSWSDRHTLMAEVGVVPEVPDAPPTMSASGLGKLYPRFYPRWDREAYAARLERFAIDPRVAVGRLSRGQKTQVSLSLALSSRPSLLILDDPTLGLDPVARRSIHDELIEVLAEGSVTILLTSHDLAGVELLATHVGFLSGGSLLIDEPVDALKGRFRRLAVHGSLREAGAALDDLDTVRSRQLPWGVEAVTASWDPAKLERLGSTAEASDMSLEEIFVALVGEGQTEKVEKRLRRAS